ncbi:MAG: transcriptional regulator, HxlR family [Bacteroidetes bacterium]|jgi:DNA-binding HxlR family transcriptional regulator|nr:transcriptional regulator, HxlR family [Bacteroidota bacterium]
MDIEIEKFQDKDHCPVRCILSRIGDKWSVLIINLLGEAGTLRFGEIKKSLGDISQKMLTSTLRSLEADGLILRQAYMEIPPRVEYELTDLGRNLLPHLSALSDWAHQNMDTILKHRAIYQEASDQ